MHSFAWPNGRNSVEVLSHPPSELFPLAVDQRTGRQRHFAQHGILVNTKSSSEWISVEVFKNSAIFRQKSLQMTGWPNWSTSHETKSGTDRKSAATAWRGFGKRPREGWIVYILSNPHSVESAAENGFGEPTKKRPGSISNEPGRPEHRVVYRSISRRRGR